MVTDAKIKRKILRYQRNEITEYHIYKRLAKTVKDSENRKVLEKIAEDELRHYHVWKTYTNTEVKPNKPAIWKYYFVSKIFGLSFGLRLMEKGE